jgi:hypothetical protein
MPDKVFYVGSEKDKKLTGYVRSRFLTVNDQPVVDATPGGSQRAYVYAVASDRYKTDGKIANPNNYLVVPENFNEQRARDYASRIAGIQQVRMIGPTLARARMGWDFQPGGSEDLQRDPQWGIPDGSVVPAYVGSASHYLGFVSGLTNTPLDLVEQAGGHTNGGPDTSGPHGVSQQNHANLVKGYADATAVPNPELTNDYGYGSQGRIPGGQIGDGKGNAGWASSLYDIDPSNPTQPVAPQQTSGPLGLVSNQPMPQWPVPPPIFNTR